VLQFAIDLLGVKHVMVVGHYGCSGVRCAMERKRIGLADNWLRHVQDVFHKHEQLLPSSMDDVARHNRLCELNVIEQVVNVCQTTIVQDAWERGQDLTIHGWVYSLDDGLVRDLGMSVSSADELTPQMRTSLAQYQR
jgi:carbonic anhydrase